MSTSIPKPVRRWPAIFLLVVATVVVSVIWAWPEVQRQQRYLRTAGTLFFTAVLLMVWLLLFSRMRWKWRLGIFAGIAAMVAVLASIFEIRGVSGDLVPILAPRWAPRPSVAAKPVQAPILTNTPASSIRVAQFPQFYGPNRTGVLDEPRLGTNWVEFPPEVLWRKPVGLAWSGFAISGDLAVTQEQREQQEGVVCYDLLTGQTVWSHLDDARYATTIAGEGPRATPTISSNRVFTFGATGLLNCLDLATGRRLWSRDCAKEHQAHLPDWGFASSPLVADGKVIVSVGGANGQSLVAYAVEDGALVWAKGTAGADFSSPIEVELLGTRQILIFNADGVVAHALDGKILWQHPWPGKHPHISLPVAVGTNRVVISSGYGTGTELVRIDQSPNGQWTANRVWKSIALKSKFGPIFVRSDYIYGLDDGILVCVDLNTGKRQWKDGRYGHGQALLVSGLLLVTSEKGNIVLIEPNAEKLVELAQFPVFSDKTWNPPALAGAYLLVRNDREAACLKLPINPDSAKKLALSFAKQSLSR